MVYDDMESRRQASEAIKNLVATEKRSKLPLILSALALLALLGAGGYWYTLPPNQQPTPGQMKNKVMSLFDKVLNTPVAPAPSNAPVSPAAPSGNSKNPASSSSENTGLLSN